MYKYIIGYKSNVSHASRKSKLEKSAYTILLF